MSDVSVRPELSDVQAIARADLVERYRVGTSRLDASVLKLPDDLADRCFLPEAGVGRWSCRILLGHLADAEVACAFRMRRLVSEPGCEMAMWDQDAFIDAGLYAGPAQPMAGFVAVVHTVRLWIAEWLGTLAPEAWERRSLHLRRGEMSLHQLVGFATWHVEHHAWYLDRKLERLHSDRTP